MISPARRRRRRRRAAHVPGSAGPARPCTVQGQGGVMGGLPPSGGAPGRYAARGWRLLPPAPSGLDSDMIRGATATCSSVLPCQRGAPGPALRP